MASNVVIHLGSDAKIVTQILPTYKLEIVYVIDTRYMNIFMIYYINNKILTKIDFRVELNPRGNDLEAFIYYLEEFIISMNNNRYNNMYINDMNVIWCNDIWSININWTNEYGDCKKTPINLPLCDDSKKQFIDEIKGLLHVINTI